MSTSETELSGPHSGILYHEDDRLPLFSVSEKGPKRDSAQASALTNHK